MLAARCREGRLAHSAGRPGPTVIDHDLGDVISQSFGATEETFPDAASLLALRSAFKNAREHHVTELAGSGDLGATNFELNLSDIYPMRVNSWPSIWPAGLGR
jgi:hypothetical protein